MCEIFLGSEHRIGRIYSRFSCLAHGYSHVFGIVKCFGFVFFFHDAFHCIFYQLLAAVVQVRRAV